MSRVGSQPITIPTGVTVEVKNGKVFVSGPKGNLSLIFRPEIKFELKNNQLWASQTSGGQMNSDLHGVTRTLVANMVKGVTEGFSKTLKIVGTGYRAKLEKEALVLSLGFSHPVTIKPPTGIKFLVQGQDLVKIEGIDKVQVGQVTAEIRKIRPPEPYKGKGIRYLDEEVRHKVGKAAKAGAAGAGGK